MKKIFILCVLLMGFSAAYSGNWMPMGSDRPAPATIQLVSSDIETSTLQFSLKGFEMIPVTTPHGKAAVIGVGEASPMLVAGAPDLGKLTASVIIPDLEKMEVQVVSSQYTEYQNIEIAPSKGNIYRDIDPSTVPYTWNNVYSEDKFFPGTLAELRDPYIVRDFRGQTVVVYPFQYNPVTRTLRVYSDIQVKVAKTEEPGINPLYRKGNLTEINTEFNQIYQRHFLNSGEAKYNPLDEQGCMLIISHGAFMPALTPFVEWKNQQGIATEVVNVSSIGTTAAAIKAYILNYYNNHDLAYVLLVGDGPQIPTNSGGGLGGPSDNAYGYLVGNDHYPEIFVGRFSAENLTQVQTQVAKVLSYEKTPLTALDWFSVGVGIGSSQGPGDDNEYDYQHIRNIRTKLMNFTYTAVSELYDGSQGGLDANGNPTPALVSTAINAGASIVNYTGHGSQDAWSTSGFSISNVTALTNDNMLPIIFSVACVNGDFVSGTCFAEAWLRASHNGQPSGASATLMSTINQSWDPPMCGQDEMNDILVETYPNNIKRTFGGISMNGCMKMNDEYGSDGTEMTDTWTCFGDPSLMVRTAMPQAIAASHLPTIFLGSDQFTVTSDVEGAVVALTMNDQVIATGAITGGIANLTFEPLSALDTLKMVITAFNHLPYLADVPVIPAEGPYLTFVSSTINDASGNNNGLADYGENILLSVALKNVGVETAGNVVSTLTSEDEYITISDGSENYGAIPAGETVTITDGFAFSVADNVPDGHPALFQLSSTDGTEVWNSSFTILLNAPQFSIGMMTLTDPTGNGNGRLDPGETVDLHIATSNTGHCDAPGTLGSIVSLSPYVTVNSASYDFGTLAAGQNGTATFNITALADAPVGSTAEFNYAVGSGEYNVQKQFLTKIGLVLEDFESGGFTQFPWTQGGNQPWIISNVSPYEGVYSAKSGTISSNQKSDLVLQMEVTSDDSISFYVKTSSESGYDFLKFFLDGTSIGQWSGETAWTRAAFAIPAGNHTFKFEYMKDGSVSSGSDCAWIDYIVFPSAAPSAASVSGTVTYANSVNTPLAGLTIQLKNTGGTVVGTTTTNASGNYAFTAVPAGNYTLDVTTDKPWNGVTAADVLMYRKHIANIMLLEGIYLGSGDVNASETLTAADVLLVKKRIANIITTFPTGDWLFNDNAFTVNTGNVTQNFKGIVYGDANGSYVPVSDKSLVANSQGTITLGSATGADGNVTVPVLAEGIPSLGSFQFTLRYDPANLTLLDVNNWYEGIQDVTIGRPAPGLITFVWAADVTGVSISNGKLCDLTFKMESGEGSILNLTNQPTKQEFADYEGVVFEPSVFNGEVKAAMGIADPASAGIRVYPNPGNGQFSIQTAKVDGMVNIRILNATGTIVYEETQVQFTKGTTRSFDLRSQPAGVYMIRIGSDHEVISQKLVINR